MRYSIIYSLFIDNGVHAVYFITVGGTNMFTIGDKVAYPMHGARVIEGIEEQTILGEPRSYLLRLSHSDMKVMVPVETSGKVGVRYIVEPETLTEVTQILQSGPLRCRITGIKETAIIWKN